MSADAQAGSDFRQGAQSLSDLETYFPLRGVVAPGLWKMPGWVLGGRAGIAANPGV